jgi:hypothetical protein
VPEVHEPHLNGTEAKWFPAANSAVVQIRQP